MHTKSLQSYKISNILLAMRGKRWQRSDPVQYQYTNITSFWISAKWTSFSQNRINIKISKIYITSVINVVTFYTKHLIEPSVHKQACCTGVKGCKAILDLHTTSASHMDPKEAKYLHIRDGVKTWTTSLNDLWGIVFMLLSMWCTFFKEFPGFLSYTLPTQITRRVLTT